MAGLAPTALKRPPDIEWIEGARFLSTAGWPHRLSQLTGNTVSGGPLCAVPRLDFSPNPDLPASASGPRPSAGRRQQTATAWRDRAYLSTRPPRSLLSVFAHRPRT